MSCFTFDGHSPDVLAIFGSNVSESERPAGTRGLHLSSKAGPLRFVSGAPIGRMRHALCNRDSFVTSHCRSPKPSVILRILIDSAPGGAQLALIESW